DGGIRRSLHSAASGFECATAAYCIGLLRFRVGQSEQPHPPAAGKRQARDQIAIPAVVAGATEHAQPAGLWPAPQQGRVGGTGGALHEHKSVQRVILNQAPAKDRRLGRAVQRLRPDVACFRHTTLRFQCSPRIRASNARVEALCRAVPVSIRPWMSSSASVLPSSTPNWSKLLMPQITPCTKVLFS